MESWWGPSLRSTGYSSSIPAWVLNCLPGSGFSFSQSTAKAVKDIFKPAQTSIKLISSAFDIKTEWEFLSRFALNINPMARIFHEFRWDEITQWPLDVCSLENAEIKVYTLLDSWTNVSISVHYMGHSLMVNLHIHGTIKCLLGVCYL